MTNYTWFALDLCLVSAILTLAATWFWFKAGQVKSFKRRDKANKIAAGSAAAAAVLLFLAVIFGVARP